MARPKRASMREGPLADLFRSTTPPEEDSPETTEQRLPEDDTSVLQQPAPASPEPPATSPPLPSEPTSTPYDHSGGFDDREESSPEPESVRAFRTEAPGVERTAREPKDRLSRIFVDEPPDPGPPAYGRDEPSPYEAPSGPPRPHEPVIRVVGVGGAGVNAVNRMVDAQIPGVEFMAINTDLQSLQQSSADVTVHLGSGVTRGLGAGSDPELGYKAAFAEQDKIKRLLKGSDMVFVTAGVGGGTGTGAAPVIARLARDVGSLTVGIVTKPFRFEGTRRSSQAEKGIEALSQEVDTLIVVPNERLLSVLARTTTMVEAFHVADDVLRQGVQGISELITLPGLINLDFADVRTTMRDAGPALLGIGMGTGETRAISAAERAIASPLLETSVDGARSILLSITGGNDLGLLEVSDAAKVIHEAAHPEANIIFGANIDPSLADQVWITVVATRFDGRGRRADGNGGKERRVPGTTQVANRRPADRRAGTAKDFESKPRDLNVEVPEFLPN